MLCRDAHVLQHAADDGGDTDFASSAAGLDDEYGVPLGVGLHRNLAARRVLLHRVVAELAAQQAQRAVYCLTWRLVHRVLADKYASLGEGDACVPTRMRSAAALVPSTFPKALVRAAWRCAALRLARTRWSRTVTVRVLKHLRTPGVANAAPRVRTRASSEKG